MELPRSTISSSISPSTVYCQDPSTSSAIVRRIKRGYNRNYLINAAYSMDSRERETQKRKQKLLQIHL